MRKTFKVGRIFHIPIEINLTWFIILGLVVFTLARGYFPYTNPGLSLGFYWLMALIAALLLFASLLAHELSHSLVAIRYKIPIHSITLFIFGGVAQMEKEPASPDVEFKMAMAGPIMSFFLAFTFYLITRFAAYFNFSFLLVSVFTYLYIINLVVGIFNLIPGFPLDGGRVLRSAIWAWTKDLRKATAIASVFGKAFAFTLMGLGFLSILGGALISGIWFIFIGLFLQESADFSCRQLIMKKMLSGTKVEKVMAKNVITVPSNLTLDKLVDEYFFKYRHSTFPVMEHDAILGIATFHDIKEVPRNKWADTTAKDIMLPIMQKFIAEKEMDITHALAKMANNGIGRLLVVEKNKLIGLVSQRDIMRLLEFKSEIKS